LRATEQTSLAPLTRAKGDRKSFAPLVFALLAVAAYCLLIAPDLISRGSSWFLRIGSRDRYAPTAKQVKRILGADVAIAARYGHDGREFWILARDPLLLSSDRDATLLDRPAYRAARIAYPLAAAPWGLFGNDALLLGLLITNLLVIGVGTYFTTLLALHLRAPPMAAIFFAASPVVAVSLLLDLGDAMSLAALVISIYLFLRGHIGWATAAGVVAVLAKQPALLAIIAVAAVSPSVSRRRRLTYVAIPAVAVVAWTAYATVRLGASGSSVAEFTLPFFGYGQAIAAWLRYHMWPDAAIGLSLIPAATIVVISWWRRRTPLLAAALPFALIVPFLSYAVLAAAINSLRAFGPAITFFGLDWFASQRSGAPSFLAAEKPRDQQRENLV
jgi:hypothetical protein